MLDVNDIIDNVFPQILVLDVLGYLISMIEFAEQLTDIVEKSG